MIRGSGGSTYDRVLLWSVIVAALLLTALFAWRGNWARVLWP